jgi:hypothetical protein
MRQYALLAAAAAFAVGCSDDSTGPTNTLTAEMRADLAQSMGEVIAQDVEAMSHTEASSSTTLFAFGGDPTATGCTVQVGTLVCTNVFGSLNGEATLGFRDAQGTAQDDFDDATTASATIETDIDGTIDQDGFSLEFATARDFAIAGLAGAETSRTWSGNGTVSVTSAMHDDEREYQWTATTTFAGITVPTSGTEPRWPTAGQVTSNVDLDVVGGPDDGESGVATVIVTFNGTANVPLKVENTNYTLNLATRTVTEN